MGNKLGRAKHGEAAAPADAADPRALAKSASGRSNASGSGSMGPRSSLSLRRVSTQLRRASSRVLGFRSHAAAANARHQLEERLAEAIQAKAAGAGSGRPKVKFNRLLLRFGSLSEGFAACRAVFRELAGSEDGEMTQEQLSAACTQLGYHLDDASLARIFASTDLDGSQSLNVHEFLATLAILHILKGPEDEERVEPCILATWRTAEDAFLSCASSAQGRLDRDELLAMMHESGTDGVRHSANGRGTDPIQGIAEQRFRELDRDGSGQVSFLEFLFCLESWVEDAEEEREKA